MSVTFFVHKQLVRFARLDYATALKEVHKVAVLNLRYALGNKYNGSSAKRRVWLPQGLQHGSKNAFAFLSVLLNE